MTESRATADGQDIIERLHELYRRMGRDEDSILGVKDMLVVTLAASEIERLRASRSESVPAWKGKERRHTIDTAIGVSERRGERTGA